MAVASSTHSAPPPGDELDRLLDMDDVFRDVDTNIQIPPRNDSPSRAQNTSTTDALGIDEQIKVTKKRAPVPKLDEDRFVSLAIQRNN